MSRQNINVGTNPNDATGDTLRLAFSKVNNNFIELYATSVGTGNSITQGSYSVVIDANGAMSFPTLSTARGDVSSGTLTGQTLKFADKTQEAIIAGPNGDDTYQNAQRIIIEGGLGAANTTGEGGDIYVWAGRGGNYGGSGGDVKVRGGYGANTGSAGYVRIEGGDAATTGSGGFIDINGGATYDGYGGDVNIRGGYSSNAGLNGNVLIQTSGAYDWKFNSDGTLTFPYNGDHNIRTQRYGMGNVVAYLDNGWTLGEFNGIGWGTEGMRINPGIEGYADIKLPSDADSANGTPISISSYSANGNVSIYANSNSWLFNNFGSIKLPGNLSWSSSNTVIESIPNGNGEGYSVLNIIPDVDKFPTDQYIIIDPGITPSHIHLRAGGSMDDSSAILSLGGDASYFRIDSGPNPPAYIASNTKIWTFNQEGGLEFPDSTTQTTAWSGIPGPYADDAAAAANSVNVGNPYYRSTGLVYVRLA